MGRWRDPFTEERDGLWFVLALVLIAGLAVALL